MRFKKIVLLIILLFVGFCVSPTRVYAQVEDNTDVMQNSDDFPEDPGETDVPFDSGIYVFIVAAVVYGIQSNKKEYHDTKIGIEK